MIEIENLNDRDILNELDKKDIDSFLNSLIQKESFGQITLGSSRDPNDKSDVLLALALKKGFNNLPESIQDFIPSCIATVEISGNKDESLVSIIPLSSGLPKNLSSLSQEELDGLINSLSDDISQSFSSLVPDFVINLSKDSLKTSLNNLYKTDLDILENERIPNLSMFYEIAKSYNLTVEQSTDSLLSELSSYTKDLQARAQNREMYDAITESFADCLSFIQIYLKDNYSPEIYTELQPILEKYSSEIFSNETRINAIKSEVDRLDTLSTDIYNFNKSRMEEFRFLDSIFEKMGY